MSARLSLLLLFLAFSACNRESDVPAATPHASVTLPSSLRLESAPPAAQNVIDARKTAADGADIVVTGKVRDFIETRAVFTIADLSLKSCADRGESMDDCKTPWDYCCVDPRTLAESTATIELHNGDALAMGSAQGWNGLDHLKQIIVKGKAKRDAKGNLAVIASGIFVQP